MDMQMGFHPELTVGLDSLTDFLKEQYLTDYIARGGSKIKMITGRSGSGKTHLARIMMQLAEEERYIAAYFSAKEIWLHDFREIYLEILRQCDIELVLTGCSERIIRDMGYNPAEIPEGKTFMDYLSERGEADPVIRQEIRAALREYFTRNPRLDNNFACCCSLLTGGILGHPVLENASRELLLSYLAGDKSVKLSQLRSLGLSPARVTRFNARYLLRSLAEVVHLSGMNGILVVIDDMEQLLVRAPGNSMRYTKLRREDTYESIRQLIDDIDNMRYMLFFFGFDRELMDNDSYGMKSYQALWMRVQNEVVSARFNRFADIIDLDRYADEFYTPEVLCAMSEKLCAFLQKEGRAAHPISPDEAQQLEERGRYGGLGLPYLVGHAVMEGGREHV